MTLTEADLNQVAQLIAQMMQSNAQPSHVDAEEPQHQPGFVPIDQEMSFELHSIGSHPHYSMTSSPGLTEFLSLQTNLFRADSMSDSDRTRLIEAYLPIENLTYNPPQAFPTVAAGMTKAQKREVKLHRQLQYVSSAIFRPLDILAHEIALEPDITNTQRNLHTIRDIRHLLLHNTALFNSARKNVAFRVVNPTFSVPESSSTTDYTMALQFFNPQFPNSMPPLSPLKTHLIIIEIKNLTIILLYTRL